jgi:ATP-binding cassette subfamily C protein
VAPPGSERPIVGNIRFRLKAGEVLGIIGPSGAGKTSLMRTLTGVWPAAKGAIRLDGAALDQWNPGLRGQYVGYMGQSIELFDGTVAENIARMQSNPDIGPVLAASQAAGAHDMILRLTSGYETRIGDAGAILSAGQRQRIGLARALYGEPFLLALDEPNSNLDNEGDSALLQAIRQAKARGAIVILISHRRAIIAECDRLLLLGNGAQQAFGPPDEVLKKIMPQPPAGMNLKVVE